MPLISVASKLSSSFICWTWCMLCLTGWP